MNADLAGYCRDIEIYLCRKNDGHLIRVVGPSFDRVSSWAERGIPLKVAFEGIDRYFERYYRAGPRRRPVKIDFCEADVLDVFDEWRRATGIAAISSAPAAAADARSSSLPSHLERVMIRLSSARASGAAGPEIDPLIDRLSHALDRARGKAGGLRGAARQAALDELAQIDAEMLETVRARLDADALAAIDAEAEEELRQFRAGMSPDAYDRARQATAARLIRQKFNLPTILFD